MTCKVYKKKEKLPEQTTRNQRKKWGGKASKRHWVLPQESIHHAREEAFGSSRPLLEKAQNLEKNWERRGTGENRSTMVFGGAAVLPGSLYRGQRLILKTEERPGKPDHDSILEGKVLGLVYGKVQRPVCPIQDQLGLSPKMALRLSSGKAALPF